MFFGYRLDVRPEGEGLIRNRPLPLEGPVRLIVEDVLVKEHDAIPVIPPLGVRPLQARKLLVRRFMPVSFQSVHLLQAIVRQVVIGVRVLIVRVITTPATSLE